MPTDTTQLLTELIARLPELEWKISSLGTSFSGYSLPPGLFRADKEARGIAYIAEIKSDIQALSLQHNQRSVFYLAQRLQRKINVLVRLCQIEGHKTRDEDKGHFGIKMLSTRQQWIQNLERDIQTLQQQLQALNNTLAQMLRRNQEATTVLQLKAELGEVEQRLTLAQETLKRATT